MIPGEPYPTGETDQQCRWCERWFSRKGIYGHEPNCDWKNERTPIYSCPYCDLWEPFHRARCSKTGVDGELPPGTIGV